MQPSSMQFRPHAQTWTATGCQTIPQTQPIVHTQIQRVHNKRFAVSFSKSWGGRIHRIQCRSNKHKKSTREIFWLRSSVRHRQSRQVSDHRDIFKQRRLVHRRTASLNVLMARQSTIKSNPNRNCKLIDLSNRLKVVQCSAYRNGLVRSRIRRNTNR